MTSSGGSADERVLHIPGGRRVDADRLRWRTSTSSGPGGQHANRTATRVEVGVCLDDLPLREHEVERLRTALSGRITRDGWIAAAAQDERSQLRNRALALERLEHLIASALHEDVRRIPTRISRGAQLRRRASKQHAAQKKSSRRWRWPES